MTVWNHSSDYKLISSGLLTSHSLNSAGVWVPGERSTVSPLPCLEALAARLFLGPRGFHGHASTNHSWITPVPPHSIRPKRGAGSAQPTQGPQDGAGTHCSAARGPGHTEPLHLVQQVEVVDGHANVRLAFAVPPSLSAPHPARDLLQDGAGRFGGQEVVVGRALKVEAHRRRHGRRSLSRGRIRRGRGAQRIWVRCQVRGDGGAEQDSSVALTVLQALALVIHRCGDPSLLEEAN